MCPLVDTSYSTQNTLVLQEDWGPGLCESEQVEIGIESTRLSPEFLCSPERLKPISANTYISEISPG